MKVRVEFTVDIDPAAWEAEYGVSRLDVRNDVRDYIKQGAHSHLSLLGVLDATASNNET